MIFWISLALAAQLITAGTVLVDKYVLLEKGHIGNPVVYAFYVSLLSAVVLVLVPFGYISIPSVQVLEFSLLTAGAYILSLLFLYKSLKVGLPSDVVPVVGAVAAVSSYIIGYFFLKEDLPQSFALAFILFTLGTLIISHFRFTSKLLVSVLCAGFFFGLSSIFVKYVFIYTGDNFIDGFFWSRMANVVGALLLLAWPANWRAITSGVKHTGTRLKGLVIMNKALSGAAYILTLRAIDLGSVTIVNALAGVQFVFLFIIAFIFSGAYPRMFRAETHRPHEVFHKLLATIFIVAGMAALFINPLALHI